MAAEHVALMQNSLCSQQLGNIAVATCEAATSFEQQLLLLLPVLLLAAAVAAAGAVAVAVAAQDRMAYDHATFMDRSRCARIS